MSRTIPVVLQILCNVVFSHQISPAVLPNDRVQVAGIEGLLSVVLRDALYGNVKRIEPVVVGPVLQRDREVVVSSPEVAVVYVIHREFFVITS